MSLTITGDITLDKIIPLIDQLSNVEREELRQFLEAKPKINWQDEWEKVVTYFQSIFIKFPEKEIKVDFNKAIKEVRLARKD